MTARSCCPRSAALLALVASLLGPLPAAAFNEPQAIALGRLRAASAIPVDAHYEGAFPRTLRFDVAAPAGATPAAKAQAFLLQWSDVFSQGHEDLLLLPAVSDLGEQDVVAFSQSFRGIPIFGARLAVGMRTPAAGGPTRVQLTTGWLLPALPGLEEIDLVPAVTPQMAADAARIEVGMLDAPVIGDPPLMLFSRAAFGESDPPDPVLVYRVTLGGGIAKQLLVDAHSLEIVFEHGFVYDGPGLEDYDADFEDANGGTMASTNCFNPTTIDDDIGSEGGLIEEYLDDPEAGALWWHTRNTYLAYHNQLGRHSWDDDDGEIRVYTHIGTDPPDNSPNARYSGGCDEIEFHDLYVGLDVVGHEFTHGVIRHSLSDLVYQGQSGALNEAFADSMAALVVDPSDWLLAEGLLNGQGPIRSMSDPLNGQCDGPTGPVGFQNCNDPDRWSLALSFTTDTDNGNVHSNSGIQNKATFLMADGGQFNGHTITGIGRSKTSRVIYFLTRFLLPSTATFMDARNFAVVAAQAFDDANLYGFTASDVCTVRNAYAAVEVGNPDVNCDGAEEAADGDGDGVLDVLDNCVGLSNPSQTDVDADGIGDACDNDGDNDGIPNGFDKCPSTPNDWYGNADPDGDGLGNACDNDDDGDGVFEDGDGVPDPCESGQTVGCDDNCPGDFNPTQFDGNDNGEGDACDPDQDGDGLYVEEDNCTFVFNPDQANADGDEYGDACDDCPNDEDEIYAYTPGFPELGVPPEPYQPDSDGDGIPDACDDFGFGRVGVATDGIRWGGAGTKPKPDGARRMVDIVGEPNSSALLPIDICDPDGDPDAYTTGEYVELGFEGLPTSVLASVIDDSGRRAGISMLPRPQGAGGPDRGFRFKPRCDQDWFLLLELGPDFPGADQFTLVPRVVAGGPGTDNPWSSLPEDLLPPPDPPADGDEDGAPDAADNCPNSANPEQLDADGDSVGDVCDNCTLRSNEDQRNTNRDAFGNRCDPDYDGDGRVGLSDFNTLRSQFGKRQGVHPDFDTNVDHDGDGVIGLSDFNTLRMHFGGTPGPAGALPE